MRAAGVTVFGCTPDEVASFEASAPGFDVVATVTSDPASESNAWLAEGNWCVSIGHRSPITAAILRAFNQAGVEYLSTRSIGSDHIDLDAAADVGITVETVEYAPDGVADYTLMLMLMAVRSAQATILRSAVHDYRLHDVRGRELRDLTVGVVGTGRIGSAVVDRLRGFGCRVVAHDRRSCPGVAHVPLDELLRESDVVTLHTPLTADTHHLLDRRRIALMKRGAYLVNTGRGPLLDTGALVAAIESGRLGGAAIDVVEGEDAIFSAVPNGRRPCNDLLLRLHRLPNVIISPHTAYFTDHCLNDTVENTLRNCLAFERNRHHG